MINSIRKSTFNGSTPLHYVVAKLFELYDTSQDDLELTDTFITKKARARILPKPARTSCLFAPDTVSWLRACAIHTTTTNIAVQSTIYIIPLLGITNRPLAGYKKAGFNLYKTLVKLTIPDNVKNLDQCTIEFSSRLPVNIRDFVEELERQICIIGLRVKRKGRLTFYSHGRSSIAAMTDLGALRLSALKAMPVVNIDWLDPSENWERLWNPCTHLESMKSHLENRLIDFLDRITMQVCASQCNAVMQRAGCFFDSTYLPHRKQNKMPVFNKTIFLPASMLHNDKSADQFDTECNLLNYLSSNIGSGLGYRSKWNMRQVANSEGWLPVTI